MEFWPNELSFVGWVVGFQWEKRAAGSGGKVGVRHEIEKGPHPI
jgi:hypothetical protein